MKNVSFARSLTPPNTILDCRHFVFLRTRLEMHLEHVLIYAGKSQVVNYESRFKYISAIKSRVAPLKELTIPRMKIQAAVQASRLYKTTTEEGRLQLERVIFFTDSMVVLTWIPSQSRE